MRNKLIEQLFMAASIACSSSALSQDIDIKGIRLGMDRSEVIEKFGPLPLRGFTVAGVHSKYSRTSVEFFDEKVDSFVFFFDSSSFDGVLNAVKEKFPAIRCSTSSVSNRMGATFSQVDCSLRDALGTLSLNRFVSDLETSVISLRSHRAMKEFADRQKAKSKDL